MTVKPIKPNEVVEKKVFPDEVITAFNELIAKNFSQGEASFKQEDIVKLIVAKGIKRNTIYPNHLLDVEELYRAQGWEVEYDKPGFNETYEPTFTFRKKK